jgi:hypothetical protein
VDLYSIPFVGFYLLLLLVFGAAWLCGKIADEFRAYVEFARITSYWFAFKQRFLSLG